MSEDRIGPEDVSDEQLLEQVLQVFSRVPGPGDPPLESLPPSRRLIENAPLTEEERNTVLLADCRFYGIKPAPPDDPIYQQGWTLRFVPRSKQSVWPRSPESKAGEELNDVREDTKQL